MWLLLQEYIESLMEREQRSEKMNVKDPRSEEETAHASDLINLILVSTHTHTHIEYNNDNVYSYREHCVALSLYYILASKSKPCTIT